MVGIFVRAGGNVRSAGICALVAIACTACEPPKPTVEYGISSAPDPNGLIKFRINKSAVIVDYAKSADGKGVDKQKLVVTAVPQEDQANTYTIGETSGLLGATHLKVTKRENTDLLLSIGSEVEDRRIQLIQQGFTALGAVIAGAALVSDQGGPPLPQALDISETLSSAKPGAVEAEGVLGGLSYRLSIAPVPKDALPTEQYVAAFGKTSRSNVLFYAACRNATLTFTSGLFVGKTVGLKVSDPNFLQTIAMPAKGVVTFHPSCGVNVASEKPSTATDLEIVNELIKQAKTLLESTKKK